jgi:hypothetical protein
MKTFKEYISEGVMPKDMLKAGFVQTGEDKFTHPDYKGYTFKLDDRNKVAAKDPKGVWDTTDNIAQMKNVLKNFKGK